MSQETFTREELLNALRIEPCHITGCHEPDHHLKYTCADQRAASFVRVLALLGVDEMDLPRDLHGKCEKDCYWCHGIPNQEQYRARNRRTHEWAGVEIPPELAALAPDHPKFDVSEGAVLSAVKRLSGKEKRLVTFFEISEALGLGRHSTKYQRPLHNLVERGKLVSAIPPGTHTTHVRPA